MGVFIWSALAQVATAHYYLIYHPQQEAASVAKKATKIQAATAAADSGHHQVAYIENYIGNLADKVTKPKGNT
ncbi:hypothetical protein [Aeromonas salmonicida]|uniref:hypothetical protein n=1 Tax=Aeromonas salmonicida TaxID=645 RepID=UPI003D242D69